MHWFAHLKCAIKQEARIVAMGAICFVLFKMQHVTSYVVYPIIQAWYILENSVLVTFHSPGMGKVTSYSFLSEYSQGAL